MNHGGKVIKIENDLLYLYDYSICEDLKVS